jgi:hypothetical protein
MTLMGVGPPAEGRKNPLAERFAGLSACGVHSHINVRQGMAEFLGPQAFRHTGPALSQNLA